MIKSNFDINTFTNIIEKFKNKNLIFENNIKSDDLGIKYKKEVTINIKKIILGNLKGDINQLMIATIENNIYILSNINEIDYSDNKITFYANNKDNKIYYCLTTI